MTRIKPDTFLLSQKERYIPADRSQGKDKHLHSLCCLRRQLTLLVEDDLNGSRMAVNEAINSLGILK